LFISLAVYSYLAARLLLLVPILFVALHWLITKLPGEQYRNLTGNTRPLLFHISKFYFLLLLFLSPLIIYFLFNPADFMARSTTVSIINPDWNQGDFVGAARQTLTLTLGTFVALTGDTNPLLNLPRQPALPLFLAPFFLIGFGVALSRIFAPRPSPLTPLLTSLSSVGGSSCSSLPSWPPKARRTICASSVPSSLRMLWSRLV
jgi:hypothetical protein